MTKKKKISRAAWNDSRPRLGVLPGGEGKKRKSPGFSIGFRIQIATKTSTTRRDASAGAQVDFLVFECLLEPFDKDIVVTRSLAVRCGPSSSLGSKHLQLRMLRCQSSWRRGHAGVGRRVGRGQSIAGHLLRRGLQGERSA